MADAGHPKLPLNLELSPPEELPGSSGPPRGTCGEVCPLCNNSPTTHDALALLTWLSRQPALSPQDWDALQWHLAQRD